MNKVILCGRLGDDPEIRYTGSDTAVSNLRLATDDSYRDSDGELVERTEWHDIVVWARLAEIVNEYLEKGSQVLVEGRLQTRKWEDRDGNTRYSTEVVARNIDFLGGGSSSGNGSGGGKRAERQPAGPSREGGGPPPQEPDEDFEFEPDDELPF